MLNISRQIYIGYNSKKISANDLPDAVIIPLGESSNEKKRLEGFTQKFDTVKELDNVPLPGFTLKKASRRSWSSPETDWIIIDPRGFTSRITTSNLEQILHVTGITEGLIQEKCVWARENTETKMILVPITSELYIEAVKNTELIEGKINIKEVEIGDTVLLQNKLQGVYMGSISLYGTLLESGGSLKAQSMLRKQVIMVKPDIFHYQTDAKILKVVSKAEKPMTKEESCAIMNASIESGSAYFTSSTHLSGQYYSTHGRVKFTSPYAVPKPLLTFVEIDNLEATGLWHDGESIRDEGVLMLENEKGKKYLVDYPYSYGNAKTTTIHSFTVSELQPINENSVENLYLKPEPRQSSYYSYGTRAEKPRYTLDKFVKFYKIVKNVKNTSFI